VGHHDRQFLAPTALLRGNRHQHPLYRLAAPQSRYRRYKEALNLLHLPRVQPRFISRPADCLITALTELHRLSWGLRETIINVSVTRMGSSSSQYPPPPPHYFFYWRNIGTVNTLNGYVTGVWGHVVSHLFVSIHLSCVMCSSFS
jgi:hypothetical protein